MVNEVLCPLVDKMIDAIDCIENRDIKEEFIPDKYKVKENWKEICQNCPYHEW